MIVLEWKAHQYGKFKSGTWKKKLMKVKQSFNRDFHISDKIYIIGVLSKVEDLPRTYDFARDTTDNLSYYIYLSNNIYYSHKSHFQSHSLPNKHYITLYPDPALFITQLTYVFPRSRDSVTYMFIYRFSSVLDILGWTVFSKHIEFYSIMLWFVKHSNSVHLRWVPSIPSEAPSSTVEFRQAPTETSDGGPIFRGLMSMTHF